MVNPRMSEKMREEVLVVALRAIPHACRWGRLAWLGGGFVIMRAAYMPMADRSG
jgi:hypothetical protein